MAKLGCGPLAAFMLIVLILLLVGSNEAIGYYFSHCQDVDLFECLMGTLEEDEPEDGGAVATGVYEYKGYSVTVTVHIPLGGGTVTGSVSGTCEGSMKGTYNGQNNGAISASMSGVCSPFFVNIPASAEWSGTVRKTGKAVPISFTGRGGGMTHEGSMTLTYP